MDYQNITTERKEAVLIITVTREKALNAMNKDVIAELQHAFDSYKADDSLRCVILTGAGPKAFVAGADIKELNTLTGVTGHEFSERGLRLMRTIQSFPLPVIAAINGFALGGGSELALACDIRLAADTARLGQPEVKLGLCPGYGGTQRLTRLVGRGKAMQIMLTGGMFSAAEAHRIGYVDEVYPADELMDKAMAMANEIAAQGPVAVRLTKELVNAALEVGETAGCEMEKQAFALTCATDDKNEGTTAFLEKRAAAFTNK